MLQEVLAIFLVSDGKTNQPILSTQANLDSYCATEAPNLGGCKHKKAHNGSSEIYVFSVFFFLLAFDSPDFLYVT